MRAAISELNLRRAASLSEALDIVRDEPRTAVAGATDLFVALNFGTLAAKQFVDIWALDELRDVSQRGDVLSIGALATYTTLIASPLVNEWLPMLVSASRQVGGAQIQNRGTIGGNIANASPAGDSLPVFAAVDATVVLRSADSERRVPFNAFYIGYRKSVMRSDELIVAVEIPRVEGKQWFRKVGTRVAQAISKIVIAGVRGAVPRIALGSVAPTVVRARNTELAIAQGMNVDDAAALVASDIAPIDDIRSTADYRRLVATNLVRKFLAETH